MKTKTLLVAVGGIFLPFLFHISYKKKKQKQKAKVANHTQGKIP